MPIPTPDNSAPSFSADAEFLRQHVDLVVLGREDTGARVAVVPGYQGRVMTSTAGGTRDSSYGWINHAHIAAGELVPHINAFGGEERFWLGPEGGQFSIFFAPGSEFVLDHWQTPTVIDTEPFAVVVQNDCSVSLRHQGEVQNYSGTGFRFRVDRTVDLLSVEQASESLGHVLDRVSMVGYRTTNRLTNVGPNDWTKGTGLLSIWILGMYRPGPRTTIVIPFRKGGVDERGPEVNDAYFGQPPADRLRTVDGTLYFSGDGRLRSKIGLSPSRAREICGSWDAERSVLTIVRYNQPPAHVTDYVNSMWELQELPYGGDAVNAYNDGPPAPDADPLGPFYELESSSPALALAAGQAGEHVQLTCHFEGERAVLDPLARTLLGRSLRDIEAALA